MARKSLFEELTITIEKGELARLLGAAEGFRIDAMWDKKTHIVFSLIRATDFNEESVLPVKPEDLFRSGNTAWPVRSCVDSAVCKRLFSLFLRGERRMILKSSYQQVMIVVDRDELADLLLGQPGFEIEKIEDQQSEVHFIFGRKTDHDLSISSPSKRNHEEEQKLFSMQEELRQARRL